MTRQISGQIYLADQRGLTETRQYQRFSTLHFGAYQAAHKGPIGALSALNEELLAGGQQVCLPAAHGTYVLVLPVTGAVKVAVTGSVASTVDVGEVLVQWVPAGAELQLRNPYPDNLIQLLHLWIQAEAPAPNTPLRFAFEAAALTNQLAPLIPASAALPLTLHLGRLAGRHEVVYQPRGGATVVAFVLAGAFEAEGRLLHEKDALALWDAPSIELEALSNDALLLLLELPR